MTGLLLDHLWQCTLFAFAAGLVALALGRNAAHVRFWVWFAAAAKFLVPCALIASAATWLAAHLHTQVTAPAHLELARQVLTPMTAQAQAHAARPVAAPIDWRPYAMAAWALGSAAVLSWRAAQWRTLSKALAAATPAMVSVALPAVVAPVAGGPAVAGFLRQVLVLPPGLTERLTPAELEAVLEHEMQHARRRDNLLTLPLLAAQVLFWFHPLVWWIGRRLLAERERACDEGVVQSGFDAETYARSLLQACRLEIEPSPAWTAGVGGGNLKLRIRRIMSDRAVRSLGIAESALLAVGAGAALAVPIAAGLFVAPAAAPRLLASLTRLTLPSAAAMPWAAQTAPPAPVPVRPAAVTVSKIALRPQTPILIADSEPGPRPDLVRLTQSVAAPMIDAPRAGPVPDVTYGAVLGSRPSLVHALASKTAYVVDAGVWRERLELRTEGACPTAQVARAEAATAGETISTAFDGEVRHFVDDAIAGRPAPRDLSPVMARAVDAVLPALQPVLARTFTAQGHARLLGARLLGEDTRGRDVYLVRRDGEDAYALVLVNDLGKIEAGLFCAPA